MRAVILTQEQIDEYFYEMDVLLDDVILDRAGFFVDHSRAHIKYNEIGNIFQLNKVNGTYEFTWGAVKVTYVHELLAMIFVLCGEELYLKIKQRLDI